MNRKVIAVLLVAILVIGIVLGIKVWGFGTLLIEAYSFTPRTDGGQEESAVRVGVFDQGKKIGESQDSINLPVGKHILSFGDYSSDYDTPLSVDIDVQLFQTTKMRVNYTAKWGILKVTTSSHDAYSETEGFPNATIFIDDEARGAGEIVLRCYSDSLGQHRIAFAPIEGYATPSNETVQVEKSKAKVVSAGYEKILTEEQQHYVWLRRSTHSCWPLDKNSNTFSDRFFQWISENRINIPLSYFYLDKVSRGSGAQVHYYITQYAGVLLQERIDALDAIYARLKPIGFDIEHGIGLRRYSVYFYSDQGESIVVVELEFTLSPELVEESSSGTIFEFNRNDTHNLPNLFPGIIPAGIAVSFRDTARVYVKIGESTRPLEAVYTSFANFTNPGANDIGGYYNAYRSLSISNIINFYLANSISQMTQLIQAAVMGSALLNPANFCEELLWEQN